MLALGRRIDTTIPGLDYYEEVLAAGREARLIAALRSTQTPALLLRGMRARLGAGHVPEVGWPRQRYRGNLMLREELGFPHYVYRPLFLLENPLAGLPAPLAELLEDVREVCNADFDQVILSRYRPGAHITPHTDEEKFFGDVIAAASLASSAEMEWTTGERAVKVPVRPRSLYVMRGAARRDWKHCVPKGTEERFSITFRTLLPDVRARLEVEGFVR